MNLLLSDRALPEGLPQEKDNRYIDLSALRIAGCIGCFGCWVKTPGRCVLRDDATQVYPLIARSNRVLYVSRVFCGSYDVTMKTMLERSLPIQQAFIRLYEGETHHLQRAVAEKEACILAYGAQSAREEAVFQQLVARNAKNMLFKSWRVLFPPEEELEAAVRREVQRWQSC